MADAGIDDMLVANEVVGPDKIGRSPRRPGATRMTVAVDSTRTSTSSRPRRAPPARARSA